MLSKRECANTLAAISPVGKGTSISPILAFSSPRFPKFENQDKNNQKYTQSSFEVHVVE